MLRILHQWYEDHFSNPQVAILAISLIIGFSIVVFMGNILMPFFAALIFAYLLDGIVVKLERLHVPRTMAVVVVFLLFMTFLFFIIFAIVPMVTRQLTQLVRELPMMIHLGQAALARLPEIYPEFISESQIREFIATITSEVGRLSQKILSWSLASVTSFIAFLVYLILVPLMVFFFLKDRDALIEWFTHFLPEDRPLMNLVWSEVNIKIASYVRGKATEIIIVWAISYATFALMGLEFAMLLAMLVGVSVLIPYVGATVATIPIAFIAYIQWGFTSQFAYLMIAYAIIQFFDGNILVPLLFSEVVNLHPIAIVTSILVFGGLWGFWGIFFAIPLATLVHAIIKAWPTKQIIEEQENLQELQEDGNEQEV
ncbi:AI-2E family transporter [Desulfurispira natronophila]|uniref:Putative permease n=1 Tax=Desulfurispira natronophila TaxID=682562 RepID=A0A7W7Y4X4_9BACT|nr:AI-2E family transporter [Desulfurispira natronophila]MBB5022163.1 putative permease [Desulfurispira natronophila]